MEDGVDKEREDFIVVAEDSDLEESTIDKNIKLLESKY
jgi:hypothetical protein